VVLKALDNLDQSFKDVYKDIFSSRQVNALIGGRYFDRPNEVLISLDVVSLSDGTLIDRRNIIFAKRSLPGDMTFAPVDLAEAQRMNAAIGKVIDADPGDLAVSAATNRGKGGVYRTGEKLTIHFFSTKDTYVKIYHIDVKGNTELIFPNRYWKDNFIRGKTSIDIPTKDYPFEFVISPPYGTEYIKVIASTLQFTDMEESYADLGQATRSLVTRGLRIDLKEKDGQAAETLLAFSIIE
jgi:hypothetical protein